MSPAATRPRLRVLLQGFGDFERSALASYFRLAGQRFPAYEETKQLDDAAFAVVDADDPAAVQQVVQAGRVRDAVFIGAQAPEGALAWMMRPIDPLHVLRELDAAVAMRHAMPPAVPAADVGAELPARRAADQPPPDRTVSPDALIVDDDESAARALERELQAQGLSTVRVNTSGKALELMGRLGFRVVFIDTALADESEMDGFNLCQYVKRQHRAAGAAAPVIVLMAGQDGPVDRVRSTLAQCDAYLPKPVEGVALRRLLAAHGASAPRPGVFR